jgi:predicted RNase H-like HicB family nuclease
MNDKGNSAEAKQMLESAIAAGLNDELQEHAKSLLQTNAMDN